MELQNIKIKENNTFGINIFIDDREVEYVKSLDLHLDADSLPQITLETAMIPDAELRALVNLVYTPISLQGAATIFCDTMTNEHDSTIRNGMIASIASALKDYNLPFMPEEELAEHILNRIVGTD